MRKNHFYFTINNSIVKLPYTDVTRELAKREFADLEDKIKRNEKSVKSNEEKKR